jgi:hypothetical protein
MFSNRFFNYNDKECSYKPLSECYQTPVWNQAVEQHRSMLLRYEDFFNHSDTTFLLSTLNSLGQGEKANSILHPWNTFQLERSETWGPVSEFKSLESRLVEDDRCAYFGTVYKVHPFLLTISIFFLIEQNSNFYFEFLIHCSRSRF